MSSKKPQLDEATLRVVERMLRMPPKPHDEMKVGKRKASRAKSPGNKRRKSQAGECAK